MTKRRDEFLTELIGGRRFCVLEEGMEIEGTINGCDLLCVHSPEYTKGGYTDCSYALPDMQPEDCEYWQPRLNGVSLDFSTWAGFGKLWEWAQEQEWWRCKGSPGHYIIEQDIHPDRFADALYKFLKERQNGTK